MRHLYWKCKDCPEKDDFVEESDYVSCRVLKTAIEKESNCQAEKGAE